MRRLLAVMVVCALGGTSVIQAASGARGAQATAVVAGTARSTVGQPMANSTVQLRNLATGQLAGKTTSTPQGEFRFQGLDGGRYAVEVVNGQGQIVGTSAAIDVMPGALVQGVGVSASAGASAAAAGSAAASTGLSTATIVTITAVAAGAGVGAWAIHRSTASPSQ